MDFQNMFQKGEKPGQTMLSCYCYYGDEHGTYPLHCHSYYEISYIFSGRRTETINDKHSELSENSLIFLPPLTIHDLNNNTSVHDAVIQFSHNFIKSIVPSFDDQHMLIPNNKHMNSLPFQGSDKADICCAIGVETLPYFSRLFTKYTGMNPRKYRA